MKIASTVLAAEFLSLGAAELAAIAPMRKRADHPGYSTAAYRGIGAVEIAGAGGLLLGPAHPAIGTAAGAEPVLLMAGAVAGHVRNGDGPADIALAAGTAVMVTDYLVALAGVDS